MLVDTRVLAWEAGRKWGLTVNTISAGPLKSRAASAIGEKVRLLAASNTPTEQADSVHIS